MFQHGFVCILSFFVFNVSSWTLAESQPLRSQLKMGKYYYEVEYSDDKRGAPSATVTKVYRDGKWTMPEPWESVPTTLTMQTLKSGETFAYQFEGQSGIGYAQVFQLPNGTKAWHGLPYDEGHYRRVTPVEKEALLSLLQSRQLQNKLDAQRNNPSVLGVMQNSGAAYHRFYSAYTPLLPKQLPPKEQILALTDFKKSERGTYIIISPKDPARPAIFLTTTEASRHELEETANQLRRATTQALISLNYKKREKGFIERTRSNTYLVVIPGKEFSDGLGEASRMIKVLPNYVAANSVLNAYGQAGPFRTERAASGGLGRRRFDAGLADGTGRAVAGAQNSINDTANLIALKAEWFALRGAARLETKARESGKSTDLLGFEIDFLTQRSMGIEYAFTTEQKHRFFVRNVGKNFQYPDRRALPANIYGRMNAQLIAAYEENGRVTNEDVVHICLPLGLYPTHEGEIIYFDPADVTPETAEYLKTFYQSGKIPKRSELVRNPE